uniref:ATP-dependent (S)-NAD(P)H-hydrate dehydratase n=2 Tax=Biomphalaria glabrata TaxID=6526 RepID=A0A2C9M3E4_BIOGL
MAPKIKSSVKVNYTQAAREYLASNYTVTLPKKAIKDILDNTTQIKTEPIKTEHAADVGEVKGSIECCRNRHILNLHQKNNHSLMRTAEQVFELFGFKITTGRIDSLLRKSKNWASNFSRDSDRRRYENFCNEPYVQHFTPKRSDDRLSPTSGHVRSTFLMSTLSHSHVIQIAKSVIPPLHHGMHKGQAGRVAVLGGCQEYTGAPYFAAITALKVGADLSHVFCTSSAATVIKSYSPELIVHPVLDSLTAVTEISQWLPRFHSLVVGPGLGRDEQLLEIVSEVIQKAREQQLPIVIDADGLFLVTQNPDIIRGYTNAVLTPNVAEFDRLYERVLGTKQDPSEPIAMAKELSKQLGHVTVVQKGSHDIITNGDKVLVCSEEGSPRRCGGQGDLLSGALGTFLFWSKQAVDSNNESCGIDQCGYTLCAAYASCSLTRLCNKMAFRENGRSTTTTDMIAQISKAFITLYEKN